MIKAKFTFGISGNHSGLGFLLIPLFIVQQGPTAFTFPMPAQQEQQKVVESKFLSFPISTFSKEVLPITKLRAIPLHFMIKLTNSELTHAHGPHCLVWFLALPQITSSFYQSSEE